MKPKVFSEELRGAFLQSLEAHKDAIAQIKASNDAGSFEVVVSTEDQDRQGEVVKQDGWNLENYAKNPIVLWAHDYSSLPIGVCDEIKTENGQLKAKGRFAPEEANPFAQQVRRLYDLKIVRATSVGFIASQMEGNIVTQAELLEFSFVPVPANPLALSLNQIKDLKLDLPTLALKGLEIKAEEKSPECRRDGETKSECVSRKIPEILKDNPSMKQEQAIAIAESMCSKTCGSKADGANDPDAEADKAIEEKIAEIMQRAEEDIVAAIKAEDEEEDKDPSEGGEGESGEGNPEKEKSGRRISRSTKEKLEEAMRHLEEGMESHSEAMKHHKKAIESHKAAYAALEELLATAEPPKPGEGEEPPDGEAPEKRSSPATSPKNQEELDTFLLGLEIVRQIEAVAREGLGKLKARTRKGRS